MITLNYRDSRPIYEQIREGLKRLIVTGAIAAGERLPSVRTLATQLSINPNTIQRAYAELEREGYCYSIPGKGSFVSDVVDMGEKRRQELRDRLCALAAELKFLGASEDELMTLIRSVPEGAEPDADGTMSADAASNAGDADNAGALGDANGADRQKEETA